jgi:thioredoxin-like negative regulator of GroEL
MTKKQCPLGEDCDLTIAWMKGAEDARDKAKARIEALERRLAKAVKAMQEAIKLADMPHYGDREDALDNCFDAIDLLRNTLSELNGDKP